MTQQQMARIHCSQCDGWYDSEHEFRDHMRTAHRRSVPEQSPFRHAGTQPDSFENQLGMAKEE
jgi:hypothetical protein